MAWPTNSLHEKPEAELIGDARDGNADALSELFRRHYPGSIAIARRILPAQEEFLDAVQSAYLSAFRNFRSFRGEASFKTWIRRIVLNQCLMRLREPSRHMVAVSVDQPGPGGAQPIIAGDSPTPEDLALRSERSRALADAAAALPRRLGDVFTRCSISGFSIREAAETLGISEEATKTRLFRARSILRRKLHRTFSSTTILATSNTVSRL
jgi:RNA polymerase sigma-70 factor (ECF subfamily)